MWGRGERHHEEQRHGEERQRHHESDKAHPIETPKGENPKDTSKVEPPKK